MTFCLKSGQFAPFWGGQFGAIWVVNILRFEGGQFAPKSGGQHRRFFQFGAPIKINN